MKRKLKKRLLFSLIPLIVLLVLVTIVAAFLEKQNVISTKNPYQRITCLERDFLYIVATDEGKYYQITPPRAQTQVPVRKRKNTFRIVFVGGSFIQGNPYIDRLASTPMKQIINKPAPHDYDHDEPRGDLRIFFQPTGEDHQMFGDSDAAPSGRTIIDVSRSAINSIGIPIGNPINEHDRAPGYGGVPSWTHAILAERYPSLSIEVLNASFPGADSSRVLSMVEQLIQVDPDLVIIASGNNEGYVPKTPFNEQLSRWSFYRLLQQAIKPAKWQTREDFYFGRQDPETEKIIEHYQHNMGKIVQAVKARGVPLVLATLPINLKYDGPNPAFIDDAVPFPRDDKWIQKGRLLQKQEKYREALEAFSQSEHPVYTAYFVAQCFEQLGEYDKAKFYYKIFVQHNPMGRTRPSFNSDVRALCLKEKMILVDWETALENLTPHGIPGDQYFWDNCHLTWEGYNRMALELIRVLTEHKLPKGRKNEPLPSPSRQVIIDKYNWQELVSYVPEKWWNVEASRPQND